MSYILDALRKADAERERGNVPGIHAQPMFAGAPQNPQRAASRPWFLALAAAALVLLVIIAALMWKMSSGGAAPTAAASGPTTSSGSVAASGNSLPPPVSAAPTAIAAAPAVAPPVPRPSPETAPAPAPAPAPRKLAKSSPEAVPAKAALPTLPPASAGEPRVYTYAELPDDIRRQLPAMTVGGSVYSPVPANRFIFVNGQVLHEGDVVAPGVVLQQIRIKAAVLTVGGYRYLMNY
jgi:general secretion pathway protein B